MTGSPVASFTCPVIVDCAKALTERNRPNNRVNILTGNLHFTCFIFVIVKVIYKLIKVIYSFSSIKVRLIAVLWAYSAAKLVEIKLLYTIFALNLQNSKRKRLHKQI